MEGVRVVLVQLGLAAAAGNLVLVGVLLFGAQDRAAALVTLLLLLTVFPWSLAVALQSVPEVLASFGPLLEIATLALFWIPPTALHVACRWTHHHDCRLSRSLLLVAYGVGGLGFGAQAMGLLPLGGPTDHGWGVMRGGSNAWLAFAVHGLLTLVCIAVGGFWCWARLWFGAPAEQKLGARVWLASALAFVAPTVSNYLVVFGFPVLPAGSLGNLLFLCVLAFFVTRRGFLHVRGEVRRLAAGVTLGMVCVWLLASLWFALVSPPLLSARWVSVELAAAGAGGAILLGYGLFLQRENTVPSAPKEARREPHRLLAELSNVARLQGSTRQQELSELVVDVIQALPHVHSAAIYRRAPGAKLFRIDAHRGLGFFPLYASDGELASHFSKSADREASQRQSPQPFRERVGCRRALADTVSGLGQLLISQPQSSLLVSWPIPRLGQFEGYVVAQLSKGSVDLLDHLPVSSLALALGALWHNLELRSRGKQAPAPVAVPSSSSWAEPPQRQLPLKPFPGLPIGGKTALGMTALSHRLPEEAPALRAIVGQSQVLLQALDLLRKAANLPLPVLLVGETGTGKELFARALHALGPRKDAPFQAINCAAIPSELAENELFGHERGAYTGAVQTRPGWLTKLSGGVLFLDEVAEMPLPLQAKLLRVLEYGEVTPLGSTETHHVDVRVIAATSRSLEQMVQEQRFREDLYHRLRGIVIAVPPLRERLEDIPLLVEHFLREVQGAPVTPWPEEAFKLLMSYSWPGNIRELRSLVLSVAGLCEGGRATVEMIESALRERLSAPSYNLVRLGNAYTFRLDLHHPLAHAVRAYKRAHVTAALWANHGDACLAARVLGLTKSNFNRLLRSLGLQAVLQKDLCSGSGPNLEA